MKKLILPAFALFLFLFAANVAIKAQTAPLQPTPTVASTKPGEKIDIAKTVGSSLPVQTIVLLTLLSFIPAILISMTCFTRLIVVFHFLRQAIGTQETPNNQILLGLSLFITLFVMSPTLTKVYNEAYKPMSEGTMSQSDALEKGLVPLREYMFKHTRERDLALFIRLSKAPRPNTADDVPTLTLVPAFMISELKTAFQIGFILFLPFLIIDLAVSSVLLSMGMMQLPPVVVSMPLKILLFVMVDGWYLIVGSLVKSVM